jgi:hypothetical protein
MSQLHPGAPAHSVPGDALYEDKRADFPIEQLEKYSGRWVAFSHDEACRIVDSCASLAELKIRLQNAGHDPHGVVFSRIPAPGEIQSGSDFS